MAADEPQPGPSSASTSKRGSVFEDSDLELKRLAAENENIPLKELATRVREDENGPKAERARQILGMRWLLTSCERAADTTIAVPRNRVYARYVSMCANERIKPLNPASFGKLVRLMYPEIKTRRLGVRGHSKYHYCGIKLKGDPASPAPKVSQGSASGSEPPPQMNVEDHLHSNSTNNGTRLPIDNFFSSNSILNGHTSTSPSSRPSDISSVARFLQYDIYFPPYDIDEPVAPPKHIILPDISPYAPPDIDLDVAASLAAIYRSHCTSLVECVRYMRLKQFFGLFVSFQGTLTAPVQKLFAEPSIALWIRESDWATYKHMIELLSPLALQVVPAAVMSALRQFSASLTSHISTAFANMPPHVIEAKVEPSAIFSSLLERLLRVNEAAHAAARILVHSPDRTLMRQDWRKYVNCKAIVDREVPCSAAAVQRILEDEIINLLQPQPEGPNQRDATPSPGAEDDESLATTESVLDRWTQFLAQLPHRFPQVSPRLFLLSVGAVASAALRDMTMAGGESFGGWWVVRCWIDEWIAWTAERGGFLRHGEEPPAKSPSLANGHQGVADGAGTNSESELGPDDSGVSLREEVFGNNEDTEKMGTGR
ncbi:RFX DNA-binding domain-containing protein [Kalaharituber pfeilii]|nr:RFX DNA-binding domain-containing protein [Kalaharituber pfeilii]